MPPNASGQKKNDRQNTLQLRIKMKGRIQGHGTRSR